MKQFYIFQAIYGGAWGKKIQPITPMLAHRFQTNHLAWEVFYCTNDVICIKSLAFWFLDMLLPTDNGFFVIELCIVSFMQENVYVGHSISAQALFASLRLDWGYHKG